MNTFFALALAATLSTAPNTNDDSKTLPKEATTYIVTDNVAIWLSEAGKLKLAIGQDTNEATIEFRSQKETLYTSTIALKKAVHQTFDLWQLPQGNYQIRVTIGGQVISKTIQIESVQSRTCRLI
ncbi:hypothetical protein [Spirosoma spitsbergense]|uniref:hypothetical protein n=1 Tax=Spirosoma spitsbergense TaxID=431554 RepID=UPI00035EB081|nr:hypothetical protein [Spirosoma spitsbergense]